MVPFSMDCTSGMFLIGTSGYDYPEWKGVFYPEDLPRTQFLPYYASQFNALELNNTFYSMPTRDRFGSFYDRSEGRLQFSVKAHQSLTHQPGPFWQQDALSMAHALEPLAQTGSLSAVLFQLPQRFHYTPDNRRYLSSLLDQFSAFPAVVEFRHAEWIRPSVFEGLEQRNVSLAFCDMPSLKVLPDGFTHASPFVGPNAYIRLHGRNAGAWYNAGPEQNGSARYDYEYTPTELEKFVPVIEDALSQGKKVQVFCNNHPKGSGAKNALQLRNMCFPR